MIKLNYPLHDLGRYPKVWKEGSLVFGRNKQGVTALLDDTSIQAETLDARRDILSHQEIVLAPLPYPILNYKDFLLSFAGVTSLIDSTGHIFLFRKSASYNVVSFEIISIVEEFYGVTTTFKRTLSRDISAGPPPIGSRYGMFLQHERYGEIFLGYSAEKVETEIRA